MELKKINVATAVTISGTMSGSEISPNESACSPKRPARIMPVAAKVAISVATVAAVMAMTKLFQAADLNFSLSGPVNTSTYQRNENSSQITMEGEALKL